MDAAQDDKKKIEAVLFTTGRFMAVEEIAAACELGSVGYVKELLQGLVQDYEQKQSALSISEHEGTYKLNIKKEYGHLANKLVSTTEFDNPTTKTLAIIAYKNPALQSDIIHIRGNKAYEHIHVLKEQGLVTSEPQGRTKVLKLTNKFFEYFDTPADAMSQAFRDTEGQIKKKTADKAGMTVEEIEEKQKILDEQEQQQKDMQEKIRKKPSSAAQESSQETDDSTDQTTESPDSAEEAHK